MQKYLAMFLLTLLTYSNIHAEIEFVTVNWTPLKCQSTCVGLLHKEFSKIQGVAEISINQPQGFALLKWYKGAPFSSVSIKTAMKMVGLSWHNIRVRVKGSIEKNSNSIFIVSEGDHTTFELINPVIPDLQRQTAQYNQGARLLSPELRKQLLEAQAAHKTVVIEGPLFMPERSPALVLVVEKLTVIEPKEDQESK